MEHDSIDESRGGKTMELGKINKLLQVQMVIGWLSVLSGIVMLFLLNIGIITDFPLKFEGVTALLYVCFFTSIISLINKKVRPLGIWGLCITLYGMVFLFTTFLLGWAVNPFP